MMIQGRCGEVAVARGGGGYRRNFLSTMTVQELGVNSMRSKKKKKLQSYPGVSKHIIISASMFAFLLNQFPRPIVSMG